MSAEGSAAFPAALTGTIEVPLAALRSPAWVLDAKGRLVAANAAALDWLNLPAAVPQGEYLLDHPRFRGRPELIRAVRLQQAAEVLLDPGNLSGPRLNCQPLAAGGLLLEVLQAVPEAAVAESEHLQAHVEELQCALELTETTAAELRARWQTWIEYSQHLLEMNLELGRSNQTLTEELCRREPRPRRRT